MVHRSKLVLAGLVPAAAFGLTSGPSSGAAAAVVHHPRESARPVTNYGWSASNWSGYAISGGTYHAITGRWTVTAVSSTSRATYSSSWIGIDGFSNSDLIQTGTEADYYSGGAHYDAWWEILPAAETVIPSISAHPGDHMSASITKGSGSTWTITITDTSNGESFTTQRSYSGPGTSAEWIEEAPEVGGSIARLAHYGEITFDPGTVNGGNPGLTASDSGIMVQNGAQVSTPSNPDGDTDGFNAKYGSSQPSPPSS